MTSNSQSPVEDPYRVEPCANQAAACACGHGTRWTITWKESWQQERTELTQSWEGHPGKERADETCELMNMAFEHGAETQDAYLAGRADPASDSNLSKNAASPEPVERILTICTDARANKLERIAQVLGVDNERCLTAGCHNPPLRGAFCAPCNDKIPVDREEADLPPLEERCLECGGWGDVAGGRRKCSECGGSGRQPEFRGPPFTEERFGSLWAAILAERNYLRLQVAEGVISNTSSLSAGIDYRGEYRKLAGCYTREGLKAFIAQHFPDLQVVDPARIEVVHE